MEVSFDGTKPSMRVEDSSKKATLIYAGRGYVVSLTSGDEDLLKTIDEMGRTTLTEQFKKIVDSNDWESRNIKVFKEIPEDILKIIRKSFPGIKTEKIQLKYEKVMGIRGMDDPAVETKAEKYADGEAVGKFTVQQAGKGIGGVEPKFKGTKAWQKSDTAKLMNPEHKFFQMAQTYFTKKYPGLANKSTAETLQILSDSEKVEEVKKYIMENEEKFTTPHILKKDYAEKDLLGEVKIPYSRAKGNPLHKKIHQASTAATPREKNLESVFEALSNDLFLAFGVEGQKLKLLQSKYKDGTPKLLLDSKAIKGFETLEGQIKYGHIVGNQLEGKDDEGNTKLYPIDTKDFASAKIIALLMADRDKVGSKGGNIGYVIKDGKALLRNIDTGKSLQLESNFSQDSQPKFPKGFSISDYIKYFLGQIFFDAAFFIFGKTDRMTQKNLHSDFSFDQPDATIKDKFMKGYKQFTIFDDTKLSEKMRGMKQIIANWDSAMAIFDAYEDRFEGKEDDHLNFAKEIKEARVRLTKRKEYFEEVFKDRLNLSDEELDFLDHVEKFTSPTTNGVKNIKFQHLAMDPSTRKEWKMEKISQLYYLTYKAKSKKEAEKIAEDMLSFIYPNKEKDLPRMNADRLFHYEIKEDNTLEIRMKEENFTRLTELFSEANIAKHKKQPLANPSKRSSKVEEKEK